MIAQTSNGHDSSRSKRPHGLSQQFFDRSCIEVDMTSDVARSIQDGNQHVTVATTTVRCHLQKESRFCHFAKKCTQMANQVLQKGLPDMSRLAAWSSETRSGPKAIGANIRLPTASLQAFHCFQCIAFIVLIKLHMAGAIVFANMATPLAYCV